MDVHQRQPRGEDDDDDDDEEKYLEMDESNRYGKVSRPAERPPARTRPPRVPAF